MNRLKRLAIAATTTLSMMASAQNGNSTWAIEGSAGMTFITDKTHIPDDFHQSNGAAFYVGAEYFIPGTRFSARLGYQSESLYLGSQSISADQHTVMAGARWYPAPTRWMVQPHIGLGAHVLVDHDNTSNGWQSDGGVTTSFSANIHSPRFAFSPSVGFDVYVFSSIALFVDYSHNIGFNNRYDITYAIGDRNPVAVSGNLNHGTLQMGLKITFPFHFTSGDRRTLFNSVILSLFPDERY